jgi:hypothetical protein
MQASDKLILALDSDELKEYLSRKSPGDTCKFEVTATIDEVTKDQAVLSVTAVEHDEETAPPADEGGDEGEEEPVMKAFGPKKKAKAPAPAAE